MSTKHCAAGNIENRQIMCSNDLPDVVFASGNVGQSRPVLEYGRNVRSPGITEIIQRLKPKDKLSRQRGCCGCWTQPTSKVMACVEPHPFRSPVNSLLSLDVAVNAPRVKPVQGTLVRSVTSENNHSSVASKPLVTAVNGADGMGVIAIETILKLVDGTSSKLQHSTEANCEERSSNSCKSTAEPPSLATDRASLELLIDLSTQETMPSSVLNNFNQNGTTASTGLRVFADNAINRILNSQSSHSSSSSTPLAPRRFVSPYNDISEQLNFGTMDSTMSREHASPGRLRAADNHFGALLSEIYLDFETSLARSTSKKQAVDNKCRVSSTDCVATGSMTARQDVNRQHLSAIKNQPDSKNDSLKSVTALQESANQLAARSSRSFDTRALGTYGVHLSSSFDGRLLANDRLVTSISASSFSNSRAEDVAKLGSLTVMPGLKSTEICAPLGMSQEGQSKPQQSTLSLTDLEKRYSAIRESPATEGVNSGFQTLKMGLSQVENHQNKSPANVLAQNVLPLTELERQLACMKSMSPRSGQPLISGFRSPYSGTSRTVATENDHRLKRVDIWTCSAEEPGFGSSCLYHPTLLDLMLYDEDFDCSENALMIFPSDAQEQRLESASNDKCKDEPIFLKFIPVRLPRPLEVPRLPHNKHDKREWISAQKVFVNDKYNLQISKNESYDLSGDINKHKVCEAIESSAREVVDLAQVDSAMTSQGTYPVEYAIRMNDAVKDDVKLNIPSQLDVLTTFPSLTDARFDTTTNDYHCRLNGAYTRPLPIYSARVYIQRPCAVTDRRFNKFLCEIQESLLSSTMSAFFHPHCDTEIHWVTSVQDQLVEMTKNASARPRFGENSQTGQHLGCALVLSQDAGRLLRHENLNFVQCIATLLQLDRQSVVVLETTVETQCRPTASGRPRPSRRIGLLATTACHYYDVPTVKIVGQ